MGNASMTLQVALMYPANVVLADAILPYDNLHVHEIEAFWRMFYADATSFALTKAEFRSICLHAACFLRPHTSRTHVLEYADDAFELFLDCSAMLPQASMFRQQPPGSIAQRDDYLLAGGVIDALEFLSAIAFIAAIRMDEKIDLLFDSWDMSKDGALDLDEFTISLKSTLAGLTKIVKIIRAGVVDGDRKLPSMDSVGVNEDEVDILAERTFREIASIGSSAAVGVTDVQQLTITCEQFRTYCTTNSTAKALFDLFDAANGSSKENTENIDGNDDGPTEQVQEALIVNTALKKAGQRIERQSTLDAINTLVNDDAGDEFLAVKPWKGAVVPPTTIPTLSKTAPLVSIYLKWVFGYNAQECKNNVRYVQCPSQSGSTGGNRLEEIVYPAAATCIVFNTKTRTQRHHVDHTDDILSLCLHPTLSFAASGEIGKSPKIIVWDLRSMDAKCILQGFHERGVLHLAFQTAELLVSVGGSDDHSIAVYESKDEWRSAALIATSKGNKAVPFHLATNSSSKTKDFITCGQNYIDFWSLERKTLAVKKGILGKKGTLQPFLVAEYLGSSSSNSVVVGTMDGYLYLFNGRDLSFAVKAHGSAVNALHFTSGYLLSGGKDGQVIIWDEKLKMIGGPFQIKDILTNTHPQYASIRSCCFSPDRKTILLGTQASEIYEIDAKTGANIHPDALIKGHFHGEVWGLDMHPFKQQCCTVGDDQTLRIWDLESMQELRAVRLECPGRACAYSSDGKQIAVGLGVADIAIAGSKQKKRASASQTKQSGGFVVLNEQDLVKVKEPCYDPKKWVSDIKFSPDNRILAVASHDTSVYFYDVLKGFTRRHIFKKHSSYVTHLDFSSDGNYLQSTSGAYELLFNDVNTGKQITSATTFRDERWHTMTSTLGWGVQGIWEEGSDGTDVNSVDRSKDGHLLATGDDFGKVKVFKYPCAMERASFVELRGHASHVTTVRWSFNDAYIVSVGGNDRCVFVWKHEKQSHDVEVDHGDAVKGKIDDAKDLDGRKKDLLYAAAIEDDIGDEFMAVKPWLGAIVAPSNAKTMKQDSTAPYAHLELEYVHGYQAQNASNNARYDVNGKIVYHAAALGITYDKLTQQQHFFKNHNNDIVALCSHPNGSIFATAQMGKKPKICVWNSINPEAGASTLEGFHLRFVSAICFSSDGKKVGSVGGDDDHSVAIYSWESGILSSSCKGERNNVVSMCFHSSTGEWVTCGEKHIRFWTEQGKHLSSKKAIFGKAKHKDGKAPQTFECVVSLGRMIVSGASNGDLYVFQNSNQLTKITTGHTGNVFALYPIGKNGGEELISGGKDAKIMIWDSQINLTTAVIDLKEMEMASMLYSLSIRSVCTSSRSSRIFLIGTAGSDLLEVDATRQKSSISIITQGHSQGELWGLATHPHKPEYCTVGDDQTLRVWSVTKKCQLRIKKLEHTARVCAISSVTDIVAVGYGGQVSQRRLSKSSAQNKTGTIVLLRYTDLSKMLFEDKPSNQAISEIKFAPNGQILAVGSHDHNIFLYKIQNTEQGVKVIKAATFSKHQSYITHLDFSLDSRFMQSNCGAYELLFSDATSGKHITSATATRDVQWHTWTCVLGWPVQGIWPPCSDGTDVNAVDRSVKGDLLVSADDFGLVKLYRYPCVGKNASSIDHHGHSSHVTNVRWCMDDAYIISTGGNDRCIMQWKAVRASDGGVVQQQDVMAPGSITIEEGDADEEFEEPSGDEFMAVKPWVGAIVPPSNAPTPNAREPDLQMELEWVYGYQTELSRQNLVYNEYEEVVYHTAAVGVIYDPQSHFQRHHLCHNDDITSCAISNPKRNLVATGERGKKPSIRVWDAHTGELRCEMKGFHARGVLSLAFSQDMRKIVSIGDDDDHSVAVWEDTSNGSWTKSKLLATAKGDKAVNQFAVFAKNDTIVTGGAKHVLFWKVEGNALTSKKGKMGKQGTLQNFPCGCTVGDDFITGTAAGELYIWRGDEVARIIKAHDGETRVVHSALTANGTTTPGYVLLSGGKDGKVIMWNANYQSLKCYDLTVMSVECFNKAICSVFMNALGTKVLIGTLSSDILEVDATTGSVLNGGKPLLSGHFTKELWGLAVHPQCRQFITAGDDGTLRMWDMDAKQLLQIARLPGKSRACTYSPDGTLIATGMGGDNGVKRIRGGKQALTTTAKDGAFAVFRSDGHQCKIIFEDHPAKEWISDIKFSPCGKLLAMGSHDNTIQIYSLATSAVGSLEWKKRKPFAKHNSYITHLDFSSDSQYLQSNCGAYEYLFCNTATSDQVRSASAVKDVSWHTWTCPLGWPVQGIWPAYADGTDINAVCASSSRTVLASGDDAGLVKVFRYPSVMKGWLDHMVIATIGLFLKKGKMTMMTHAVASEVTAELARYVLRPSDDNSQTSSTTTTLFALEMTHRNAGIVSENDRQPALETPEEQVDSDGDLILPRRQKRSRRTRGCVVEAVGDEESVDSFILEAERCTSWEDAGSQIWRAAFLLVEWLYASSKLIANKTILELGSGIGDSRFAAIVASRKARCVYATDADVKALELMQRNVTRNSHGELRIRFYDWESASGDISSSIPLDFQWNANEKHTFVDYLDVIIASDVFYDDDTALAFLKAVYQLMQQNPRLKCYVALERRVVFSAVTMSIVSLGYDIFQDRLCDHNPCFHTHIGENRIQCSECTAELHDEATTAGNTMRFVAHSLPLDDIPHVLPYERISTLMMWEINAIVVPGIGK